LKCEVIVLYGSKGLRGK